MHLTESDNVAIYYCSMNACVLSLKFYRKCLSTNATMRRVGSAYVTCHVQQGLIMQKLLRLSLLSRHTFVCVYLPQFIDLMLERHSLTVIDSYTKATSGERLCRGVKVYVCFCVYAYVENAGGP